MAQTSLNSTGVASSGALSLQSNGTTEAIGISTGQIATLAQNPILTSGTANGVAYLNGSKVLTTGSALVFDGTNFVIGNSGSANARLDVTQATNDSTNGLTLRGYTTGTGRTFNVGVYSSNLGEYAALSYNAASYAFKVSGSQAMTLDASGQLGIGSTSPDGKFVVLGTAGSNPYSHFKDASGADFFIQSVGNSDCRTGTASNHPWLMFTNGTERARIDSSGNLLVGVTSFTNSGGGTRLCLGGSNSNITTSAPQTTAFNHYELYNNNGRVGSISTNGSATTYSTSSDYRLKNSVAPMTGALAKVAALKPVTYKWNADGSDGEGFIAHELAEVVPDAVVGEKDAVDADGNPKYQGIDTSFLVATLTAAIQELNAKFDAYKATHP